MLCWLLLYTNKDQTQVYICSLPLEPSSHLPTHPTPSHPFRWSQSTRFELPELYSKFPLTVYFTSGNVFVSVLLSQFVPPSLFPTVSVSLFSMSISTAALQIVSLESPFQIPYVGININICTFDFEMPPVSGHIQLLSPEHKPKSTWRSLLQSHSRCWLPDYESKKN